MALYALDLGHELLFQGVHGQVLPQVLLVVTRNARDVLLDAFFFSTYNLSRRFLCHGLRGADATRRLVTRAGARTMCRLLLLRLLLHASSLHLRHHPLQVLHCCGSRDCCSRRHVQRHRSRGLLLLHLDGEVVEGGLPLLRLRLRVVVWVEQRVGNANARLARHAAEGRHQSRRCSSRFRFDRHRATPLRRFERHTE